MSMTGHLHEQKWLIQPFILLQGLVARDPELPLDRTLIPSPPTRPKHPVFDNEDMGKVIKWRKTKSDAFALDWRVLRYWKGGGENSVELV